MARRPETIHEARLRDSRAEEEIHRVRHQGQLQETRTVKTANARNAAADIIAETATSDMRMVVHHGEIKSTKVQQLQDKRQKLVKKEEKYRKLINVAWIAFPVTALVYVCTLSHCCLPNMMKERKRNAERKIKTVDAELMSITNVHVRRSFSLSDQIGSIDQDRRYSGTADPHAAPGGASVYAAESDPVYAARPTAPPPSYYEHLSCGKTTTVVHNQ